MSTSIGSDITLKQEKQRWLIVCCKIIYIKREQVLFFKKRETEFKGIDLSKFQREIER